MQNNVSQLLLERKMMIPVDAPLKLVEDIENYSAFVEMQARMTGPASWYQRLA